MGQNSKFISIFFIYQLGIARFRGWRNTRVLWNERLILVSIKGIKLILSQFVWVSAKKEQYHKPEFYWPVIELEIDRLAQIYYPST